MVAPVLTEFPRTVLGRVWVHASLYPGRGPIGPYGTSKKSERWLETVIDSRERAIAARSVYRMPEGVSPYHYFDQFRGKILGSIEVYGYAESSPSPWYVPDSLAILVRDPSPLRHPVPAKGALAWWKVPPETLERCRKDEGGAS